MKLTADPFVNPVKTSVTPDMLRRRWLGLFGVLGLTHAVIAQTKGSNAPQPKIEPLVLSSEQWKQRLTPAQYDVLRKESTERSFSSPLNDEKRNGTFQCAGCELPLFSSAMKFDSGTGWPSFFAVLPGAIATKRDFKLVLPRTEYHCARCGGHQGHLFEDGPKPSGLRYCNNGVALAFVPSLG